MNPFKGRHFQRDIILWAVRWYCKYGISYRELQEMLAERGVNVDHSTIYRWVQRYAPEMEKRLRWYWRNPSDLCPWHMDEKPNQRPKGLHLDKLETLNIFGVRASYMAAFKDYLKEEGITPSDEIIELDFPTQPNLPTKKLKTLALKDGYKDNQKLGFKRTHYPWLYEIPAEFDGKIKTPGILLLALLSCLL
ncbi:IS6 family transposase, partial [Citrobacter braakii]